MYSRTVPDAPVAPPPAVSAITLPKMSWTKCVVAELLTFQSLIAATNKLRWGAVVWSEYQTESKSVVNALNGVSIVSEGRNDDYTSPNKNCVKPPSKYRTLLYAFRY